MLVRTSSARYDRRLELSRVLQLTPKLSRTRNRNFNARTTTINFNRAPSLNARLVYSLESPFSICLARARDSLRVEKRYPLRHSLFPRVPSLSPLNAGLTYIDPRRLLHRFLLIAGSQSSGSSVALCTLLVLSFLRTTKANAIVKFPARGRFETGTIVGSLRETFNSIIPLGFSKRLLRNIRRSRERIRASFKSR